MDDINFKLVNFNFKASVDLSNLKKQEDLLIFAGKFLKELTIFKKVSVVPLPDNAPSELPRLMLFSEDGYKVISISNSGFTYTFNSPLQLATSFQDKKDQIKSEIENIVHFFSTEHSITTFNNIDLSVNLFTTINESAVQLLKNNYLKESFAGKDLYQIQLTYSQKVKDDDLSYLNKLTIGSLRKSEELTDDKALNLLVNLTTNLGNNANNLIPILSINKLFETFFTMKNNNLNNLPI